MNAGYAVPERRPATLMIARFGLAARHVGGCRPGPSNNIVFSRWRA